jgi:hypothetical protein
MEACHLLTLLPVTILAGWVKGHYDGNHREFKHDLNEMADTLAGKFNKHQLQPSPQNIYQVPGLVTPFVLFMIIQSLLQNYIKPWHLSSIVQD